MIDLQNNDRLLSRNEAAKILGVKMETLASWACTKKYEIPYVKIGSKVFYKYSDLCKFVESRVVAN
jgi:excisionase family DNA binding protein